MLYFIIGLAVVLLLLVFIYNGLVVARQRVKEGWSTIETQLKRRYDLIPNLVETVKGYAKHEAKTLEAVIAARNAAMQSPAHSKEKGANENVLTGALKSIFALAEQYPDLKANQNFADLQRELSDTETKIQATRQFYNTVVMALNAKIEMFPSNLVANAFKFKKADYFQLEESEKEAVKQAPQVKF